MSMFCDSCLVNDYSGIGRNNICKACGETGIQVKSITLKSIVNENILDK